MTVKMTSKLGGFKTVLVDNQYRNRTFQATSSIITIAIINDSTPPEFSPTFFFCNKVIHCSFLFKRKDTFCGK